MKNEEGKVRYAMDEIDCKGNETSLKDCDFKGWGIHDCGNDEVLGVACKVPVMKCPTGYWLCSTSEECIATAFVCDSVPDCTDKSDESSIICDVSQWLYRDKWNNSFHSFVYSLAQNIAWPMEEIDYKEELK